MTVRRDVSWWRAAPHDLYRVSERVSSVYVEKSHVDRDENAVVFINRERTVRVPAAMVAVVLLGPGTRITHGAMNLLGDSGTAVCWVGEHGVRMYASGSGSSRGAQLLQRQAYLVSRKVERLRVARSMYAMRFPNEDVSKLTMQQLRGREGVRIRRVYREHAARTGVPWDRRDYRAGDAFAAGDDVNRLLSAAHACLYGLAHAAIVGIGASPGLGFVHSGSARSFVLDIADLYKAEITIPLAFDLASANEFDERSARHAFRDKVSDGRLLRRMVDDIQALLELGAGDDDSDRQELWDERSGSVPSGTSWAEPRADTGMLDDHTVITGPDLNESHGAL